MMNTTLQMTRRWIPALLLVLGLIIQTSAAQAQSRGRSSGRESNTERTERKSTPSSNQKATPQGRSQSGSSTRGSSSSRQRTTQPQNRSGSSSQQRTGQQSNSRSSSSRASNSRSGNSQASNSRSSNSRASNSRSSNSRSSNSRASNSRSGSTSQRGTQSSASQNRTRSTSNRGTSASRGNSGSSSRVSNGRGQADDRASQSRGTSTRNTRSTGNRDANSGNSRGSSRASDVGNRGRVETRGRSSAGNQQGNTVRVDGRRGSARRDATGVHVLPAPNYGWRDTRNHNVYKNRNWRYKNHKVYVNPVYHRRPHVQINVVWPWQNRYRRNWRPSYRYRQVVYVESGWHGSYRRAQVDIRTNYHHEVRYADHNKAVVDIYLDEIEVYEDGYYLGKVRRFPRDLEHIEATIYRNGDVVYDRDVFIVGDPRVGFELIATRHYDGYVMDHYDRSHGLDVGRLNFRRKRVDSRRYSRLFDPYDYRGYAPISVLPDDEQLLDYGYDAISYHHYNDSYDPYYGGSYDDAYYDYDNRGGYSVYDAPRGYNRSNFTGEIYAEAQPLTLNRTQQYNTKLGVAVKLQREATLERLK